MATIPQRYILPEERAESSVCWMRFAYLVTVATPLVGLVMMYCYSDQAPSWLHNFTVNLYATFGFPILSLIKEIGA